MKQSDLSGQWKVLLGEFIHLLGLFWLHSHTAKGARATEVLFKQLLQHLNILEMMPNHDGTILLRRVHCKVEAAKLDSDFIVLFGNVMINSKEDFAPSLPESSRQYAYLKSALSRAFQYFAEQNIHSLFLTIPGRSADKVEQFRFALNVLARYCSATKEGGAIAFRYYGRTLTIPLISDMDGRPDPNLTVMAALNGLSAINARELIRQAHAYGKIGLTGTMDQAGLQFQSGCYDQIFKVRSLRSQVIKPPVEINNRFCPYSECQLENAPICYPDFPGEDLSPEILSTAPNHQELIRTTPVNDDQPLEPTPVITRQDISRFVNEQDPDVSAALDALFSGGYASLEPRILGQRLASISGLLYMVDKRTQDPAIIERILEHMQVRLRGASDKVLANIITQRQGIKIMDDGRAVLVGLVHPRLFDLITLVKEHVVARQRTDIIKEIAFNIDPCHINLLADGFGIAAADAHQIVRLLNGCFGGNGSFIRPTFESRVDAMSRHENVIFEILWCFLKQTLQRKDRLDFLNAIQLLMARLNDPKRALQFLLADICQDPGQVAYTDRNAFALANVLLHKENKELYVDVNRTPEDVLRIQRPLHKQVQHYAAWRLEADRGRFLAKARTISAAVRKVLMTPSGQDPGPFEFRFLMALEREVFIFTALVKGHAARILLREALSTYGRPDADIYTSELTRQHLSQLIPHLQIIVRALGYAGNLEDLERLRELERLAPALSDLDPHPAHGLRVKQMMKWVPEAVRMIHSSEERSTSI